MGQWDWVRSDREYLREQYRHIGPLSWALRALALAFLIVAIVTEEITWPFWVALGIIAVTVALDWRSRRRA